MKNATRRIGALLLALIVFVVARPTRAQDAPNDPAAAFAAAFERSKAEVRKIEALYSDFQTAPADRRSEINEAIQRVVADAKPTFDAMIDAALQAFRAAPNADPQVTDVLVSAVRFQVVGKGPGGGGDQYEAALPILEALVDAGIDQPELPMWGVLAAVVTNEFDLADKFAKVAIETGAINAEPEGGPDAEEVFGIATSYLQGKERLRARWEAEKKVRVAEAAADTNPRVELTTNKGPITIELFEDQAPTAVANFVTLVKDGFYDGLTFHRVIPHFMAQGGDPRGTGSGGPGYSIACECYRPDARMHFRGTLSMAHAGRDSGGSQFFLCFMPTTHLDGQHTVFGRVVEGFDALGELQVIDPQKGGPRPDRIESAKVLRDRGHAYEFKKLPGR